MIVQYVRIMIERQSYLSLKNELRDVKCEAWREQRLSSAEEKWSEENLNVWRSRIENSETRVYARESSNEENCMLGRAALKRNVCSGEQHWRELYARESSTEENCVLRESDTEKEFTSEWMQYVWGGNIVPECESGTSSHLRRPSRRSVYISWAQRRIRTRTTVSVNQDTGVVTVCMMIWPLKDSEKTGHGWLW